MSRRVFILGGTRSGKSSFGVRLAADLGGPDVTFVATARPGDPELDARIARHRRDRPPAWTTIESGPDLAAVVRACAPASVVLIDSLTLWASGVSEDGAGLPERWAEADAALAARVAPAILVSDEIGLGIVPMHEGARAFRDELGRLHQAVAASADEAWFMVAGLPLRLK